MQPSIVVKPGTSTAQVLQPGLAAPKNLSSSMAGSIPNVMTQNKGAGQNIVVTPQNLGTGQQGAVLPNVQIVNMKPGAPIVTPPKSVAAVSPRVVIGSPQVVGMRPTTPGISLPNVQSVPAGQQGHLLLKTENGQYQLLRVGPAPAQALRPPTAPAPAVPGAAGMTAPQLSFQPPPAPVAAPQLSFQTPPAPVAAPQLSFQPPPAPVAAPQLSFQPPPAPVAAPQPPVVPAAAPTYVKPSDNTKEKCRNFLANLLELSSKEPPSVESNVRSLIQELIDAQVQPDQFCDRLERLLNASPQPCLIGFLKKSLPLLRQSMLSKELVIEGINPPAPHIAFSAGAAPAVVQHMKSGVKAGSAISVLQNIPLQTKSSANKASSGKGPATSKASLRAAAGSAAGASSSHGKTPFKDRERKPATSSQFAAQQYSDDKMAGDDDINDVAAMGGVNLAEETQRILGSTDMIGTQIRSCGDELLVSGAALAARARLVAASHGLHDVAPEVPALLSHALQLRLKTVIEKLAVIAQHRTDHLVKTDASYEPTQDVKGQLKFLEEIDRVEKKRREETEREVLLRAVKSRAKHEEQAKLKAKAKEMQRVEMEELRQRDANLTALQAIGPRKKPRLDTDAEPACAPLATPVGRGQLALRSRLKRVNQRDMLFLLESEPDTARSLLLYKAYLK